MKIALIILGIIMASGGVGAAIIGIYVQLHPGWNPFL